MSQALKKNLLDPLNHQCEKTLINLSHLEGEEVDGLDVLGDFLDSLDDDIGRRDHDVDDLTHDTQLANTKSHIDESTTQPRQSFDLDYT
jgi:hypothetical protein